MVSDQFRRQLRQESQQWRTNGLISNSQYQQLAERYEFDRLEASARDRFVVVLIGIGSILLGLGVITFVAANWQAMPKSFRVVLLLSVFVGVNAGGFYLWKYPLNTLGLQRWQHRLGQGLLLLGALTLGANMALMAQMFHRGGSAYGLFLVWGLGVLAMAYSLRLTAIGILSLLLMGIGYWLGIQGLATSQVTDGLSFLLRYMPLVALGLFVPLAYWCRSQAIFVVSAIAVVSSLGAVLVDLGRFVPDAPGLLMAIALFLPPALLWAYDDTLWLWVTRRPVSAANTRPFRAAARALSMLLLGVGLFNLSFRGAWFVQDSMPAVSAQLADLFTSDLPLLLNPNLLVLGTLTIVEWVYLARTESARGPRSRIRWRLDLTSAVVLIFLGVLALTAFWNWSIDPIPAIATFIANVLLFLLASGFMREGLAQGQRRLFWLGLVLLVLQISSRMLEYDTGLLLKSVVFSLCGVGVIVIGLWFERYIRTLDQHPPLLAPLSENESI